MQALRFFLPLTAFAALLSCSPASVGVVDAGPTADQACEDEAFAKCSRVQACSPVGIQIRYGDEGTCQAALKQNCLNSVAAPSSGMTPQAAEACAQAVPSWDCADYLYSQNPPPECVLLSGSLPNGAGCSHPTQCQTAFCAIVPGAACGTCAPAPQPGDSCAQLTTCGLTLPCESATMTCAAYAAEGASCGTAQPCAEGLNCIGSTATTQGTCQIAATQPGAACPAGSGGCSLLSGLACNGTSMTCQSAQIAAPGQPCGDVDHQTATCGNDAKCIGAAGGTPGTCAQVAAVGGACDLVNGPDCPELTRCIVTSDAGTAGTCQYAGTSACP